MQNYLSITKNYHYGCYTRSHFDGYGLSILYYYGKVIFKNRKGGYLLEDGIMKELLENNIVSNDSYVEYSAQAAKLFAKPSGLLQATDEAVYEKLHQMRVSYINRRLFTKFRAERLLEVSAKSEKKINAINQSDILTNLLAAKKASILVIGEYLDLCEALDWIAAHLGQCKHFFILLKKDEYSPGASESDFNYLLASQKYATLRAFVENGLITSVRTLNCGLATDFSRICFEAELQNLIDNKEAFIVGFGEYALHSIKNLKIPSMVYTGATVLYSRAALNIFYENSYSLVYVPQEFNIFHYVPIVGKTKISYMHLAKLARLHGEAIYNLTLAQLYDKYQGMFINIYNDDSEAGGGMPDIQLLNGNDNFSYSQIYYDYDTNAETEIDYETHTFQNKVLVDCFFAKKLHSSEVVEIDSYNGKSFRQYIKKNGLAYKKNIMTNFMFFTTPPLINLYNQLRSDRAYEQIQISSSHIDYSFTRKGETFPLYNKACIALTKENKFVFFNYSLGGGSIQVNGVQINWDLDCVNPQKPAETAVYTPYISRSDEVSDTFLYTRAVGCGRMNIVIIGCKIICIRNGAVLLPSIGVVVSVSLKKGIGLARKLNLREIRDGYYTVDNLDLKITLNPSKGFTKDFWDGVQWSYGGAMALIKDGVCFFDGNNDKDQSFLRNLADEGWLTPLSRQTQESEIHKISRHPRTILGTTEDGCFFILVFSGRSKLSTGADYREICLIAKKYIKNIKYMINIDGGASSFLGLASGGSFVELSYTASTNATCSGLVRNVNSIFTLELI